jgi:hypothetical protein
MALLRGAWTEQLYASLEAAGFMRRCQASSFFASIQAARMVLIHPNHFYY